MELTKDQYKTALLTDGILQERSIELLTVMYESPDCQATAPQLARVLGYDDFPPVNALVGKLGKRIANFYGIGKSDIAGEFTGWWQLIADGSREAEGFTWSLKGNLFDALVELQLLEEAYSKVFPDTVLDNQDIYEGAKKQIIVNAYERSKLARDLCVEVYGSRCSVCDMDFGDLYGDIGKGFIHVHHLTDISAIGEEYKVDPTTDLRPVCPNCHAMLHVGNKTRSIEELKACLIVSGRSITGSKRPSSRVTAI